MIGRGNKVRFWDVGNGLFWFVFNVGDYYMGLFILWKLIKLYV